ncbi:spore coat protein GerQ [Paenalkalicoccus suaedae]
MYNQPYHSSQMQGDPTQMPAGMQPYAGQQGYGQGGGQSQGQPQGQGVPWQGQGFGGGQGAGQGQEGQVQGQSQAFQPGSPMPPPPQFLQGQNQSQGPFAQDSLFPGQLPIEQSYIENILRLNRGRVGTFYMTYENNDKWNAKIFKGVIEAAGRDHIIISDPQTEKRYLLLMVNLDYVTFDEEIAYDYPFNGDGSQQTSTYAPR